MSKGSTRRPSLVSEEQIARNWDRIDWGVRVYKDDDDAPGDTKTFNPKHRCGPSFEDGI